MAISQQTKAAQRCALIWFAISSEEVFQALTTGDREPMRRLGLKIDDEPFRDISKLLEEKPEFKQCLQKVRTLWLIQCSPPPCRFKTSSYEYVLQQLEEGIGPEYTAQ